MLILTKRSKLPNAQLTLIKTEVLVNARLRVAINPRSFKILSQPMWL